jgi:hypothetical protein
VPAIAEFLREDLATGEIKVGKLLQCKKAWTSRFPTAGRGERNF